MLVCVVRVGGWRHNKRHWQQPRMPDQASMPEFEMLINDFWREKPMLTTPIPLRTTLSKASSNGDPATEALTVPSLFYLEESLC